MQVVITGERTFAMKYVAMDLILDFMIATTVILSMEMDAMIPELLSWDILVLEEQQQMLIPAKKYEEMD